MAWERHRNPHAGRACRNQALPSFRRGETRHPVCFRWKIFEGRALRERV